jgi:hypothetical protein
VSQTEATTQSDYILPPMASGTGGAAGKVAMYVAATSNSAINVDLTTIPGFPDTFTGSQKALDPNPLGHYITIQAEGVDAYFVFGPTQASVSSSNAPLQSATGANVVQLCGYLPAGQERSYKLPRGDQAGAGIGNDSPCRWLAVVTKTGSGVIRVWQSSP